VWWAWVGYTLYADRFDTDDLVFRVLMGAGMLAVGVLAVAAPAGLQDGSALFAIGYALNRLVLIALNIRAAGHVPDARPLVRVACGAYAAGAAMWLGSLLLPATARPVVWLAAILLEGLVPWLFHRAMAGTPTHATHLPERFGLFTIIVLGESLVAVVLGLGGARWTPLGALVGVSGFVIAFALWWVYFDALQGTRIRAGLRARNVFIYAHLPLSAAVVTAAVGIKKSILGADQDPAVAPALLLGGGLAVVLVSIFVLTAFAVTPSRADHRLALAATAALSLAATGVLLPTAATAALAVATLTCLVAADGLARRRRPAAEEPPAAVAGLPGPT